MLVYGDIVRRTTAGALLEEVEADLTRARASHGDSRRDALVSALIGLGEAAQGVADLEHGQTGRDRRTPAQDALAAALLETARGLLRNAAPQAEVLAPLASLRSLKIEARQPEGYAFYALYPEAYAAAANGVPGGGWRVIGVRSIGSSLAAVVAAALDAAPAVTVRPVGHPFARRIDLAPDLAAEFSRHDGPFAVVDEGPGLSGSSFGAVADALQALGIAPDRIHFFPSHGGALGPQASEAHRARWTTASRHHLDFDRFTDGAKAVQAWAVSLTGPAVAPLQDLSGGGWRALRGVAAPSNAGQERLKFLHRTARGDWLLKFAGLGRIGARKLELARTLHAAGFTPEPAGLIRGFLVERWIEPHPLPDEPPPLAGYLALRAALPAEPGASLEALIEMARVNASEAGLDPAPLERFDSKKLRPRVRPVLTDNRLHRWEWIAAPDGRWLKTDALDHHAAHDLIGPQDIAWDVAGATVEWNLDQEETARLASAAGADPDLLALMLPCYLAFQLGAYAMAADAHAGWPEEAERLQTRSGFYARSLRDLLARL